MAETKAIHADQHFIIGILGNDGKVIDLIYKKFAPGIKRWILNNSGSGFDADDIFQEALITIFRQAKENQLALTCPFEAYLFLIVKRMWLNELKRRGRQGATIDIEDAGDIGTHQFKELEGLIETQEKENIIMRFYQKLGDRCREILRLCLQKGSSQEIIADQLGVSYGYLRKKKSACMAQLINSVHSANL
ncbi:hypothetical protein GCM10027566_33990 [Arachidicoccus ginsenosidivorans]|uniref:Sigma-70 family RNA polymerase sigma factor n=1 Tax=Arachidicoccus ginsenosidivorans TaxID=496057 RepID=A0A5B8VJ27_9BACT|nr:sigma-70 family RNA polymerase sigma factor [Arachidicoccus ginsenosidivorans]QEC71597.1 sigma-70 family RNA polymerase sigma factor [Arachidicoccus ginsenosidivorans]